MTDWKQWLQFRLGTVIGAIAGVLLGVIFLAAGFWKMIGFAIIIALCIAAGMARDLYRSGRSLKLMDWFSRRRGF